MTHYLRNIQGFGDQPQRRFRQRFLASPFQPSPCPDRPLGSGPPWASSLASHVWFPIHTQGTATTLDTMLSSYEPLQSSDFHAAPRKRFCTEHRGRATAPGPPCP